MLEITIRCADVDSARELLDFVEEKGMMPEFARIDATIEEQLAPTAGVVAPLPPALTTMPIDPGATAPTVAALPSMPQPTPPQAEVDANGVYWDERIHASTKTKTNAGVWKKKKGVSQQDIDAVVAEQRKNVMTVGQTPAATIPVSPAPPTIPVPPAPVAVPGAAAAEEIQTRFVNITEAIQHLTNLINDRIQAGKIKPEDLATHYHSAGINMELLHSDQAMVERGISFFEQPIFQ